MTVQQFFLTPASHSVYVNKQSAVVLSPDIALNIDYDYELERIVVRLADSEWSHIFTADRLNINERLIHTSLLSSEVTLDTNNDYINKVFLTIDNEIIEFNFAKRIGQNFVKIIQNSHYAYLNSEQAYIYSGSMLLRNGNEEYLFVQPKSGFVCNNYLDILHTEYKTDTGVYSITKKIIENETNVLVTMAHIDENNVRTATQFNVNDENTNNNIFYNFSPSFQYIYDEQILLNGSITFLNSDVVSNFKILDKLSNLWVDIDPNEITLMFLIDGSLYLVRNLELECYRYRQYTQ